MSVERTLEMAFITDLNKTHTTRVVGARSDLTATDIKTVMDSLVAKDVFMGKNGALGSNKSARLVSKQVDVFDIS